jgi:hypothetical protein
MKLTPSDNVRKLFFPSSLILWQNNLDPGKTKQPCLMFAVKTMSMDKLKPTGGNLGRVFSSRLGCACISRAIAYITKQPNLKLKTQPKQLLSPVSFIAPHLRYNFR